MNGLARLAGGVAGVATGELVAVITRAIGPTDALSRLIADRLPLAAVELAVFRLHGWDKTALRLTSAVLLAVLAAGVVGTASSPGARVLAAMVAAGVCVVTLRRPPRSPVRAVLVAVGLTVTTADGTRIAERRPRTAALAAAAAAAAAVIAHARRQRVATEASPTDWVAATTLPTDGADTWDDATPLITPLRQFHVTDVNFGVPAVRIDRWRLSLTGDVTRSVDLDWSTLVGLGVVDVDAAMVCIHNRVGWERVANARWQAVPLAALRDLVGARTSVKEVLTTAADGFTIALPIAALEAAGLASYVAVGMNGHPLTAAHGFPARFLVPGLYGQFAGVKWLTGIHFTDRHIPGDWERRGWPAEAVMARTHSRIDGARQIGDRLLVTGVAWAPPSGVAAVEVSIDSGLWVRAELADSVGPMAWRRWRSRLTVLPGPHRVRARAIRADGQVQDGVPRPPFPSGVTGYHEVSVTVSLA